MNLLFDNEQGIAGAINILFAFYVGFTIINLRKEIRFLASRTIAETERVGNILALIDDRMIETLHAILEVQGEASHLGEIERVCASIEEKAEDISDRRIYNKETLRLLDDIKSALHDIRDYGLPTGREG